MELSCYEWKGATYFENFYMKTLFKEKNYTHDRIVMRRKMPSAIRKNADKISIKWHRRS